jgi:hypothetical protein
VIKELRQQLVSLGVWVSLSTKTTSYAKALYDCLQEAEPYTDWTIEQLREHETLARDPQFAPPSQAESITTKNQHLQEESIVQQSRPENMSQQTQYTLDTGVIVPLNTPANTSSNMPSNTPANIVSRVREEEALAPLSAPVFRPAGTHSSISSFLASLHLDFLTD